MQKSTHSPVRDLNLDHYWMPFTDNQAFKLAPKLIASAEGVHFKTVEGNLVLDGMSTLWCVNAGHCRPKIVEAIRNQAGKLDFTSSFNIGHPIAFEVAARIAEIAPVGLERIFFVNSGSEAADTAMKIALAYHRLKGEGTRTRFIGRERAFHGVNVGGMSVGGVAANRSAFGSMMPGVDHMRHTHDLARSAFSRGQPKQGADFAEELESRIIPLHGPSNIAAVFVEPIGGAGGVLIPPQGYLQRLREICDRHGILLVFDEVITGFGRLGTPFASQYFNVVPDLLTFAKGVTSGAAPLGGVIVKREIHDTFLQGSAGRGPELFHGYTYSGHPLACAAAKGALDTYQEEDLFARANALAPRFEDAVHAFKGLRHVIDCRNLGLMGAIELEPRSGAEGARGREIFEKCWARGVFVRAIGDNIAFCPPLIVRDQHLDEMFSVTADVLSQIV